MMAQLTTTQADILRALVELYVETGRPPMQRELAKRSGWHWRTVHENIPILAAKGLVVWDQRLGGKGICCPTPRGIPELERLMAQYHVRQLLDYVHVPSLKAHFYGIQRELERGADE